jgi:hypothetical protein
MDLLPNDRSLIYEPATSHDLRSWSFGAVSRIRPPGAADWTAAKSTLNDEAIFGPTVDYCCACGKYNGQGFQRTICDRCGVKITTSASRRVRFGHIDLPRPVEHPLGDPTILLDAFPVLPAALRASEVGRALDASYESLLRALSPFQPQAVFESIDAVVQAILPALVEATRWNLDEASIFARGIALVRRQSGDSRCDACGFPLAGLRVTQCPGCGKKIGGRDGSED